MSNQNPLNRILLSLSTSYGRSRTDAPCPPPPPPPPRIYFTPFKIWQEIIAIPFSVGDGSAVALSNPPFKPQDP